MKYDFTTSSDSKRIYTYIDPWHAARNNPEDKPQWGILYCPMEQLPEDFLEARIKVGDTLIFWRDFSKERKVERIVASIEVKKEIFREKEYDALYLHFEKTECEHNWQVTGPVKTCQKCNIWENV